ncbi:MAG: DUF2267 domain-containing protein [Ardenticatenaceae bacterium]|nr:DUF2267 domain-containing protein [Ardenticatenaceae bacterium]
MTQTNGSNLDNYYTLVQKNGKLRSPDHAQRWSTAVLKTLGFNLEKGAKKELAGALPKELANDLTRVFWLLHFRDTNLSRSDFLTQASRRSGNTDVAFARYPTKAVFGAVKSLIDKQVADRVAEGLSPEVRELWQQA